MNFDDYARSLQQTMADAIAKAEKITAEAAKDRLAAIDDTNRADRLIRDWETAAQKKAQTDVDQNRKQISAEIRDELLLLTALKLRNSGQTPEAIAELLDISPETVKNLK